MNETTDIEAKLLDKLNQLLPRKDQEPQADTPLHDLGVDSMRLVELFVFVEMEFGMDLMNAGLELENIQSVRSIAAFIAQHGKAP